MSEGNNVKENTAAEVTEAFKVKKNSGKTKAAAKTAAAYTKEQLIGSQSYKPHRDLLSALLADGESYTREQADKLIADYLHKETEPGFRKRGNYNRRTGKERKRI